MSGPVVVWHKAVRRARALFGRRLLERDLDEELSFHVEMEIEKHRRQGLARSPMIHFHRAPSACAHQKTNYRRSIASRGIVC